MGTVPLQHSNKKNIKNAKKKKKDKTITEDLPGNDSNPTDEQNSVTAENNDHIQQNDAHVIRTMAGYGFSNIFIPLVHLGKAIKVDKVVK